MKNLRKSVGVMVLVIATLTTASAQRSRKTRPAPAIPNILVQIIRAEDERRWDANLAALLADKDPKVQKRAALAAGRIGDDAAVPLLSGLLQGKNNYDLRQMAAFALGEIESPNGADALIAVLADTREAGEVRARAVEALGKIGGAMISNAPPASAQAGAAKVEDPRLTKIKATILDTLKFEAARRSMPDRLTILLGLTAALRTRPDGAGAVVVRFLGYSDPRIVADALNTLARLRLKDNNDEVRKLLTTHADPVVRANAARVLGAAEDKGSFDALLDHAVHDADARVRVSAIRSLASLKDVRATEKLLDRFDQLFANFRTSKIPNAIEKNEILEIITVLGRLLQNTNNARAVDLLKRFRITDQLQSSETEIAFARISPETYLRTEPFNDTPAQIKKHFPRMQTPWRASSSLVQGLGEFAKLPAEKKQLRRIALADFGLQVLSQESHDPGEVKAIPDYLRAYAAFRSDVNEPEWPSPPDSKEDLLSRTLRGYVTYKEKTPPEPFLIVTKDNRKLGYNDVNVRATAAELLGEQPPSKENEDALKTALSQALTFDKESNDAVLSILGALAQQKTAAANEAIKTALNSSDRLVRQRAVALLKANDAGDFADRVDPVQTRNTEADYRRAIARIGKQVRATLVTSKGQFTIEFLPEEAPLTVDNFIQLARRGYFNGVTFHRVVPNFVVQGGDPRGDGTGGPGYSIRCEVNEVPYERAALGMALSGKDTGGSQWFVTHAPQPHLDGGYTVFGRVVSGMDVVDSMVRGDIIRRVIVSER